MTLFRRLPVALYASAIALINSEQTQECSDTDRATDKHDQQEFKRINSHEILPIAFPRRPDDSP